MIKRLNKTHNGTAWTVGCVLCTNIALAAFAAPTYADAAYSSIEKIERLLEISDIKRVVGKSPKELSKMFNTSLDNSPEWDHSDPNQVAILDEMKKELVERFTVDSLYQGVVNSFEDSVNPVQLNAQIAFFESPAGQEVAKNSALADQKRETDEYKQYMSSFSAQSIEPSRLKMVNEIVDANKFHEAAIDAIIDMQSSMLLGFSDSAPDEVTTLVYTEGGVYAKIEQLASQRDALIKNTRHYVLASQNFEFQALNDSELAQLRNFMVSDAGKALAQAYSSAERLLATESFYSVGSVSATAVTQLIYSLAQVEE